LPLGLQLASECCATPNTGLILLEELTAKMDGCFAVQLDARSCIHRPHFESLGIPGRSIALMRQANGGSRTQNYLAKIVFSLDAVMKPWPLCAADNLNPE